MRGKSRQHLVESRQHVVDSIKGKKSLSTVYRLLSTEKKSLPTTYCILPTEKGFTLVELMITMVIFVLVIAAASQIFTGLLTQFKQQSKIAETNIEGLVGLEILRQDIAHAGYGLPWNGLITYNEASSSPASNFNDSTTNPPRAIVTGNNVAFFSGLNSTFNGTDYLVIKSANVARNVTSQKWTNLRTGNVKTTWTPDCENVNKESDCTTNNTVRVIVISPGSTDANSRSLVVNGGAFFTQYGSTSGFAPSDATDTRIIYGVDGDTNLRMPFNRADYFIRKFDSDGKDIVPSRCATNTGVLEKGTVNQGNGALNFTPLLDCVADMQVDYWLDTDNDGNINWPPSDDISGLTAVQIRDRVKEIRVYIVAHEGQKDINYDFSMNNTREFLSTTEILGANSRTLNFANLKNQIGNPEYKYCRWKIYTIVVKPVNLKGK